MKILVAAVLSAPSICPAQIIISGNKAVSTSEIKRLIGSSISFDSISARVSQYYQNAGFFTVSTDWTADKEGKSVLNIDEGQPARIGSIDIESFAGTSGMPGDLYSMFEGRVASKTNLNRLAEAVIESFSEIGYPFVRAEWGDFVFSENDLLDIKLRLLPGPPCFIGAVEFDGIDRTRPATIERVIDLDIGSLYSETRVRRSERTIDRMPYVDIAAPFEVALIGQSDSCRIVYHVSETPSSRFDGAIGYVGEKDNSNLIGRVDLEFGDILGSGRAFGMNWNRKDRYSGELRLNYLEPFLFKTRFDLKLEVFQVDRDTLYIESGGSAGFTYRFRNMISGRAVFGVRRVEPESDSTQTASTSRSVGFGFTYDNTDIPENPASGYRSDTDLEYRYRSNKRVIEGADPARTITSIGMNFMIFKRLGGRFVAAAGIRGWGIVNVDGTVPADELRYVGGFNNLRGYTDQRFPAYRYGIATLEARLLQGKKSRVYLFGDFGAIKSSQSGSADYVFYPGYGFGIVAPTALGSFKVETGWGKTGFPSEAIINFGLAGSF